MGQLPLGDFATAGNDHILCRYRIGQQMPGHPVGGGGIEALSGKEGLGRIHGNDAAVKEQAAAVGIQGAEFHVMADHNDAYPLGSQFLQDLGKGDLEIIVYALGGLIQQENIRTLKQNLCQRSPLLLAAGEVIGMPVQQALQTAQSHHPSDLI